MKQVKEKNKKHSHSLILGAVQQDYRTLDPLQGYVRFRVWVAVHSVEGHHTLQVPAHKAAATHHLITKPPPSACAYWAAYLLPVIHGYPQRANKFLVAGELGSNNRKNVPVILLHDGKHEQSFLLQSCTELEERGLLILQRHREAQKLPG